MRLKAGRAKGDKIHKKETANNVLMFKIIILDAYFYF